MPRLITARKTCARCGIEKVREEFYPKKRMTVCNGVVRSKYCIPCHLAVAREDYYSNHFQRREANRLWMSTHREQVSEKNRLYRERNREKVCELNKAWIGRNRQHVYEYNRRRRTQKQGLPSTLTPGQKTDTWSYFDSRCAYCKYKGELTEDHFIPVTCGGGRTWDNIVPACKSCNSSKRHSDPLKWIIIRFGDFGIYLSIIEYLERQSG